MTGSGMDLSDWFGQNEASDVRVRIIVVESREAPQLDAAPPSGAAPDGGGATPAPRAKRPRPSDVGGGGRQPDGGGAQQEQQHVREPASGTSDAEGPSYPSDAHGADAAGEQRRAAEQRPAAGGAGATPGSPEPAGLSQDGGLRQLAAHRRVHTELPGHTIVLCAGSPWARAKLRSQEHLQAGVREEAAAAPPLGCH
jgi:hypothetical protein